MLPRYVEELDKLERVSQLCRDIKDLEFSFPQQILYEIDGLIKEFSNSCAICSKINLNSENLDGDCKCRSEDSSVKIGCKRTILEKCAEEFRVKRRKIDSNKRRKKRNKQSRDLAIENGAMKPEIGEPDVLKSSLSEINGSWQPKCVENAEMKPEIEKIEEPDVLKSNFNEINGSPSAKKVTTKFIFKPPVVPDEPKKDRIVIYRPFSPVFRSGKRKNEEDVIKCNFPKKRRILRHRGQNGTSERQEPVEIEAELPNTEKRRRVTWRFETNIFRFNPFSVPPNPRLVENRRFSPSFRHEKPKIAAKPPKSDQKNTRTCYFQPKPNLITGKPPEKPETNKQNGQNRTRKPQKPTKIAPEPAKIEKLNSILSNFKQTFYAECKVKHVSSLHLMNTVIQTLKKCAIKFKWRKNLKKIRLLIEDIVVCEENSKIGCCENLVAKLGKPATGLVSKMWENEFPAERLREMRRHLIYTSITEATVADLTKLVPKLLKFKEIMKTKRDKMADLSQTLALVMSCGVVTHWECYVISGKFVCDFILDRIIVSEGKSDNEASAWCAALQVFLANLDSLIALGYAKFNRSSSLEPTLEKGLKDFVVFEFEDMNVLSILKISADLNGVLLDVNRTRGIYTITFGTVCIGITTNCTNGGEIELRHAALEYLQSNCFTIQVKKRYVYSWGVKTSEIEPPNFMDWHCENEPQIFAVSKPVKSEFEKYIKMFANAYYVKKLHFSPNFSHDEILEITSIAESLGLQVTTEDHDVGPLLVVSRKVHPQSLVQSLLVTGQTSDEYVLIPPRNWEP